jgi:hypothetical protein
MLSCRDGLVKIWRSTVLNEIGFFSLAFETTVTAATTRLCVQDSPSKKMSAAGASHSLAGRLLCHMF